MTLTDEQKKELRGWGIDSKTIDRPFKKLPSVAPTPQKKKLDRIIYGIIIGIVIGVILSIISIEFGISSKVMTIETCANLSSSYIAWGAQRTLEEISIQVTECKQLPINFANYSYTLVAAECLNLNQGGENGNRNTS